MPEITNTELAEKQREYQSHVKELEAAQAEMIAGKDIAASRGADLAKKAERAAQLDRELKLFAAMRGATQGAGDLASLTIPQPRPTGESAIAVSRGDLFVGSRQVREFIGRGGSEGFSQVVDIPNAALGRGMRVLSGRAAQEFRESEFGKRAIAEGRAYDPTKLSALTVGNDGILPVDRDPDIVRTTQDRPRFNVRDIFSSLPTTSDSVRYVKITRTDAAASQDGKGGTKPMGKTLSDKATANVETISVLSKVTDQDVEDSPRFVEIVNTESAGDVNNEVSRQLLWGTGSNGELDGIMLDPALPTFSRLQSGDTIIDIVRRMITDLQEKEVDPDFVGMTPRSWEQAETQKGSDNRYIWAVIRDALGPRIWSLPVYVSTRFAHPSTYHHHVLVGAGKSGATVYDRGARLAVGLMEDDFARNLRTLRAEERLAFGIKRIWQFTNATLAIES